MEQTTRDDAWEINVHKDKKKKTTKVGKSISRWALIQTPTFRKLFQMEREKS